MKPETVEDRVELPCAWLRDVVPASKGDPGAFPVYRGPAPSSNDLCGKVFRPIDLAANLENVGRADDFDARLEDVADECTMEGYLAGEDGLHEAQDRVKERIRKFIADELATATPEYLEDQAITRVMKSQAADANAPGDTVLVSGASSDPTTNQPPESGER